MRKHHQFEIECWLKPDVIGYFITTPQLPGLRSCGLTVEDSVEVFTEALEGVLESYINAKEEIPWVEKKDWAGKPIDVIVKQITVKIV